MDIEVVVTKSIAYAGVFILLLLPSFVASLAMQSLAFGSLHYDFSIGILLLLTVVGVLFPRLGAIVERRLERSLFRERYENRVAISAFARRIVRILDRDRLVVELCDTLGSLFRVDRIALFLADDAGAECALQRAVGPQPATRRISMSSAFATWLTSRSGPGLREEVADDAGTLQSSAVSQVFGENGWEVVVPLASGEVVSGFIGLGRKRDLGAFVTGDLEILGTVAAEASIALENARLYDELRRSQDIIHRAGRLSAIGTLAAGIAHEIRNPLVSIQTFFQLAPQRLHDEEFLTTFLKLTEGEVRRICDLITELLNFARSPTHSFEEIRIEDEVERILVLLSPQARKQQISLERGHVVAAVILADVDQIRQVLINIVLNAIQATEAGGTVTIEARRIEKAGICYVQLEVRDTGVGIPASVREDIFNPFFTTKAKGTGLGLAIANQIIIEHGGFIGFESEVGSGTRFFVNLPPVDGAEEGLSSKSFNAAGA
jgi:signal transduction histidine kinase